MKFYVTGRSNNYEQVQKAFEVIKSKGHNVTFEWTTLPMVKPYEEHIVKAAEYASLGIAGVTEADHYILFSHGDGNGVFTEFGAALASNTIKGTPKIYVIGTANKAAAMFHYHPEVVWFDTLEEVFEKIGV
jgi:hypothetical protein